MRPHTSYAPDVPEEVNIVGLWKGLDNGGESTGDEDRETLKLCAVCKGSIAPALKGVEGGLWADGSSDAGVARGLGCAGIEWTCSSDDDAADSPSSARGMSPQDTSSKWALLVGASDVKTREFKGDRVATCNAMGLVGQWLQGRRHLMHVHHRPDLLPMATVPFISLSQKACSEHSPVPSVTCGG